MSTNIMKVPRGGRIIRANKSVRYPFEVVLPQIDGTVKRKPFACKKAADAYLKRMTEQ